MVDEFKALRTAAREDDVPIMMDGGMAFLVQYLKSHPGIMKILEAGTAVGLSAMEMASVRENITIDTLEIDPEMVKQARANITEAHLDDRIFVHEGDAAYYQTAKYYDLFFIDAAKSQYRRYVRHFLPFSYIGSVFIFDNLNFHGIVDDPKLSENRSTLQMTRKILKFRDWLMENEQFETTFYPEVGDGVAVSVRVK